MEGLNPLTLIRLHFDPHLLLKVELFSFPLTLVRFHIEMNAFQSVFTLFLKDAPDCLYLTKAKKACCRSHIQIPSFFVLTLQIFFFLWLRFNSAPFLSAYSFSSIFGVDLCERKAKNGANHICFHAKTDKCERNL